MKYGESVTILLGKFYLSQLFDSMSFHLNEILLKGKNVFDIEYTKYIESLEIRLY